MNYKHNTNYFKRSGSMGTIGLGLLVVGLLCLWVGWSMSYFAFLFSLLALPTGAVMFFIGSSGRSSDEDIDACVGKMGERLEVDLGEDKKYAKRVRKIPAPAYVEGYEYAEGLMYAKAKNSSVRSSEYTKAIIYFLTDGLYVAHRTVSLVEENVRNSAFEISFAELENVEIIRDHRYFSFNKNSYRVNYVRLNITYGGGKLLSMPIHDDVESDKLVELIKESAAEYKKSADIN